MCYNKIYNFNLKGELRMEYEIRFYYPMSEYNDKISCLEKIKGLKNNGRKYEKTSQFNHPSPEYDFYNKEIDGRFRIRITKNEEHTKCKLSWKRRLSNTINSKFNKEEEVELSINSHEYDNLIFIVKNVIHMNEVESYERYRTTYYNNEIEIAVDEYPFGIALEIENKSNSENPKEIVKKWTELLNLDINNSYKLSWDDKYTSLCKQQNIEICKHVTFDKEMPEVK